MTLFEPKILIVDDESRNIKLLSAQLRVAGYQVISANNGIDALLQAEQHHPDLILLDVMMPGMDGFEVTRRLKGNSITEHIPVVLITALEGSDNRIRGLDAGADEFLSKPVNRAELLARVRALYRMKVMQDELRHRRNLEQHIAQQDTSPAEEKSMVLVVEDDPKIAQQFELILQKAGYLVEVAASCQQAQTYIGQVLPDMVILDIMLPDQNGLELLDELKSRSDTQDIPVLVVTSYQDLEIKIDSLNRGADDFLAKPVDVIELGARVRACLRRNRANKSLRQNINRLVNDNITDRLTGAYNRHYLDADLRQRFALIKRDPERYFCIIMIDIDHFKAFNDDFGHLAGDAILRKFSSLLENIARETDVVCRYGGEEFCVVLPECDLQNAELIAQRMRQGVAGHSFEGIQGRAVTASFGVARVSAEDRDVFTLLDRADKALYRAKQDGRNRVYSENSASLQRLREL